MKWKYHHHCFDEQTISMGQENEKHTRESLTRQAIYKTKNKNINNV